MTIRNILRRGVIEIAVGLRLEGLSLRLRQLQHDHCGPRVLVVELHETLARDVDRFRRQLDWVAEHFTLISPADLFRFWSHPSAEFRWPKPAVLFTFDDGRNSNYVTAAPVLESVGARGLFFVVPEFIGLRGREAQDYYYSRIDVRNLPRSECEEIWTPMSPEQLSDLAKRGHAVGNHTLSHLKLTTLSREDLQAQIVNSAEKIESWTRHPVEAFAWPYSWNAITQEAWNLIGQHHRFCFAPCPGILRRSEDSPWLIWRTEIESYYGDAEYRFLYSGYVNPIWSRKRRQLRATLTACAAKNV